MEGEGDEEDEAVDGEMHFLEGLEEEDENVEPEEESEQNGWEYRRAT